MSIYNKRVIILSRKYFQIIYSKKYNYINKITNMSFIKTKVNTQDYLILISVKII